MKSLTSFGRFIQLLGGSVISGIMGMVAYLIEELGRRIVPGDFLDHG